jgi:hypothetical protein
VIRTPLVILDVLFASSVQMAVQVEVPASFQVIVDRLVARCVAAGVLGVPDQTRGGSPTRGEAVQHENGLEEASGNILHLSGHRFHMVCITQSRSDSS